MESRPIVGAARLQYLLTAGFINDLVESLYLFAPFALYVLLVPDRWFRSTANRVILYGATAVTITGLIYLIAAEYFFFEEFDARFNIVAYDYLAYPPEVFADIWEAYPVLKVLGVAVSLAALAAYFLRHSIKPGFDHVVRLRDRFVAFAPYAVALALAVALYPTNTLWDVGQLAQSFSVVTHGPKYSTLLGEKQKPRLWNCL